MKMLRPTRPARYVTAITPPPEERRGSAASRGYGVEWRKARAAFLALHPLCAECGRHGEAVTATVVDHIVPHRGDMALFWADDNWQPLCETCHNRKSARERRCLVVRSAC